MKNTQFCLCKRPGMFRSISTSFLLFCLIAFIFSCRSSKPSNIGFHKKPKKIILLIGDGMGITQISTLFLEKDNTNHFTRFKHIGFINTRSGSHKITDSAAGATAFACGEKTYNNSVGMGMDTTAIPNIVEVCSQMKYTTGVIATSAITHATPASFYAHTAHRQYEFDIAAQLLKSDIDFFAGGGNDFFKGMDGKMKLYDWTIDTSKTQDWKSLTFNANKKYGYLLAGKGMATIEGGRGNFLPEVSKAALAYMGKRKAFLMIEGSQIDWGGHANDYQYVFTEMQDFNETVGAVMDFAEKDGNTLVIVTADHETGGLSLNAAPYTGKDGIIKNNYDKVEASFNTGSHTAALIPVFAYGPGAEAFQGFYENNDIYTKIISLMK